MPHKHNDIKHGVDPEQIRRYLAGELDDKAMHILERQALEDPFLADALDGYTGYAPDQTANLEDLNRLLEKRVAPAKERRMIVYLRWAAAAAVLIAAAVGTMKVLQTPMKQEIAGDLVRKDSVVSPPEAITDESGQIVDKQPDIRKKSSPDVVLKEPHAASDIIETPSVSEESASPNPALAASSPAPVTASAPVTARASDILAVPPTPLKQETEKELLATADQVESRRQKNRLVIKEPRVMRDSLMQHNFAVVPASTNNTNLPAASRSYSPPDNTMAAAKKEANTLEGQVAAADITKGYAGLGITRSKPPEGKVRLEGLVKSEHDGSALAGATIIVAGTKNVAVTDQNGHFSILTDSTANMQLNVAFIGYQRTQLKVGDKNDDLKIALSEDNRSLNEVVVVGYASKKKARSMSYATTTVKSEDLTYDGPTPKRGFKRYHKYLLKHVRYPATADGIQGSVKVSFTVKANGTLADFKVVQSLQADCDTEAIRVVKEGPRWKRAADGHDKQVVVDVPFKP